jgi:hypothetical protein
VNWLKLDEVDHLASDRGPRRGDGGHVPAQGPSGQGQRARLAANTRSSARSCGKNRAIVPRGDTTIQPGDHLFLITTPDNVDAVEAWLERHERGRSA